jgi:hypothetical protein
MVEIRFNDDTRTEERDNWDKTWEKEFGRTPVE